MPVQDKDFGGEQVSTLSLAEVGLETMAYIRPVSINGRKVQVIHAADGTMLSIVPNRDLAFITVRQKEMTPLSLH